MLLFLNFSYKYYYLVETSVERNFNKPNNRFASME